jgi:hypothetical protein
MSLAVLGSTPDVLINIAAAILYKYALTSKAKNTHQTDILLQNA